jgi:hypothetical protein
MEPFKFWSEPRRFAEAILALFFCEINRARQIYYCNYCIKRNRISIDRML